MRVKDDKAQKTKKSKRLRKTTTLQQNSLQFSFNGMRKTRKDQKEKRGKRMETQSHQQWASGWQILKKG